jgi:hypothetical protein
MCIENTMWCEIGLLSNRVVIKIRHTCSNIFTLNDCLWQVYLLQLRCTHSCRKHISISYMYVIHIKWNPLSNILVLLCCHTCIRSSVMHVGDNESRPTNGLSSMSQSFNVGELTTLCIYVLLCGLVSAEAYIRRSNGRFHSDLVQRKQYDN